MTIFTLGRVNTAALSVPGNYVAIVPPQITYINGVPTGTLGIVGTASFGPVNSPTVIGTYAEYQQTFGNLQPRLHDMGTPVAIAVQQGCNNFQCVRVTDGTDVAANLAIVVGSIEGIYGLQGGTNYGASPTAMVGSLVGGSGGTIGLTAVSGVLTQAFITNGGTGYTSNPFVTVTTSGSGDGASLFPTLDANGGVSGWSVQAGGSGYNNGDTITLTGGGSGFSGTIVAKYGVLTGVTITASGSGYYANATTSIGAGAGANMSISVGALQLSGIFTGSALNGATACITPGSAANSWKLTISSSLLATAEVFDNISVPAGQAIWATVATAINNGTAQRGPSSVFIASNAFGTGGPLAGVIYTATGGADGAGGVTSDILLGVDGTVRTGMYALRQTGTSVAMLADCADTTAWSTEVAFGLSEGIYMVDCFPAGEAVSAVTSAKAVAGIDTYTMKLLHGDWIYWNDTTNGYVRLVSPQAFSAGLLANLSPEQSTLNKQMSAIVGTQKSYSNTVYSAADLQALANAGVDVIANPCPGGAYFGANIGRNTSSNAVIHGDNYTRLTNFIAATINAWMGQVVGQLQSPTTRRQAFTLLDQFFFGLWQQGLVGNADGTQPYSIVLDDSNNPPARVALGYMQANVQVQYQSIVEYMLTEIEGGQSVQITRRAVAPALSA